MGFLTEDMTRLRGEINDLRMARKELSKSLKRGAAVIRGNVLEMRTAFRGAHAEMAGRTKAERVAFVSGLERTVGDLRRQISGAHAEMARRTKAERTAFVSGLKKMVMDLREEFADDLAGARLAWLGPREHAEVRRRAKKEAERPKVKEERAEAGPEVVEEVTPDDLTSLPGIGSATQNRLNEAGIHTYAQLAGTTPEHLRQVLGKPYRLADVEEWIEQARRRSDD